MKNSPRINHIVSEDKITVKKMPPNLWFQICSGGAMLGRVEMGIGETVGDLLQKVKAAYGNKYSKIIGLASTGSHQVLDYALTLMDFPLSNIKSGQLLKLVRKQLPNNPQRITMSDFVVMKCLGEGVSCQVLLVRHKSNGKLYALKQVDKKYFNDFKRLEQVLREKKIMSQGLRKIPFTAKLYASFESEGHLNMLIEFYPGGQMFYHLQRSKLSEEDAKLYFSEMVIAFQELHANKIVYRDLKPENIMIDFDGHAQLTDFGLCKINLEKDDLTYSYCGSLEYMAPETREEKGYNYSVDFYTLGAFMYEMVVGVPPYYENNPLSFPKEVSKQFIELVMQLIEKDCDKRLTDFTLIKHSKWLQPIDWEKVRTKGYRMPLKLNIYKSYIHEEFKDAHINFAQFEDENKYDRLLDMFDFASAHPRGIGKYYIPSKIQIKKLNSKHFGKDKSHPKKLESNRQKKISKRSDATNSKDFKYKTNSLETISMKCSMMASGGSSVSSHKKLPKGKSPRPVSNNIYLDSR